jgi:hypothetical protein
LNMTRGNWQISEVKCQHAQTVVLSHINVENISENKVKKFYNLYILFCGEILRRWESSNNVVKHFVEKKCWLV